MPTQSHRLPGASFQEMGTGSPASTEAGTESNGPAPAGASQKTVPATVRPDPSRRVTPYRPGDQRPVPNVIDPPFPVKAAVLVARPSAPLTVSVAPVPAAAHARSVTRSPTDDSA